MEPTLAGRFTQPAFLFSLPLGHPCPSRKDPGVNDFATHFPSLSTTGVSFLALFTASLLSFDWKSSGAAWYLS